MRLIDSDDPDANDWLAVNQYTRKFAALAIVDRRGDVISFLVKLGDFGAGKILMPCFSKLLRANVAISASSTGKICGSTSTTVTSAPSVQ